MKFDEAFLLLYKGKILTEGNMEYRLGSTYPPSIEGRPIGDENYPWAKEMKGYFLFKLASSEWQIKND